MPPRGVVGELLQPPFSHPPLLNTPPANARMPRVRPGTVLYTHYITKGVNTIGIENIGVIAEADKVVLTPKKYIFYNIHFQIKDLHIDTGALQEHPCFDNSSRQINSLIKMEGLSFESLLVTLPATAQASSSDSCMDNPKACINQITNK
ncbi:hypothetical protein LSTR_LSTR012957 [Laodelphax striatellus]|uniref:Uncharacterized protein n=1 Tax=Laodelphax striatellus TaxID=195883 RepID=A0A482XDR2_LAOST|nr:hypothetical protein LSTR_LSTR012957 [Laodelphax striatellus]